MSEVAKPVLKIDWCTAEAARYAVENWHYSRSLPPPPHVRIGAWEDGKYIGCVLFARGANNNLLVPYGLKQTEGCELVRVALGHHFTQVTRIVAIAIRFLVSRSPGMRLIVSMADPAEGHHGGIYQGGGWVYVGKTGDSIEYEDAAGKRIHGRMASPSGVKKVYGKYRRVPKPCDLKEVRRPGKHRYLFPLDAAMAAQIQPLSRPYPKRPAKSSLGGTTTEEGGALPTAGLHVSTP